MHKSAVIVDDEPIIRLDLSQMLEGLGFTVKGSASDGFDAIELCRQTRPDVVLMDVKMPVFDGLTAAEVILSEDLAGCVVLLTAYSDKEIIQRAGQIGVTGYLVKPVEERLLIPTIEVALAQGERIRLNRNENRLLKKQLEDHKIIERAKALFAAQNGISEARAHKELQKMSMEKRQPLMAIAQAVLAQGDSRELVNRAKLLLVEREGLSEEAAYRKIQELAKKDGCSMEIAARSLIAGYSKE
jgi:two-component system, response regulator PdtaR